MTWFKDSEPLTASTRFTTDYDLSTCIATLKIDDSRSSDIGKYLVVAENEAGRDQTEATAFIVNTSNIDETPLIDPKVFANLEKPFQALEMIRPEDSHKGKPARFLVHLPNELSLKDGDKVQLKCRVEGFPLPQVVAILN